MSRARWAGRVVVAGLMIACVGAATDLPAQACGGVATNCFPQSFPKGDELKDLSRRIAGEVFMDAFTTVRIRDCGPGVQTRTTFNQPVFLNLCSTRECDELLLPGCVEPHGYVLRGRYDSQTRLNDPCLNFGSMGTVLQNPRIGLFSARGTVQSCTGAALPGVSWTMEGTIGTNTSSPPLPQGCGNCYVCHHHTGILKIVGLNDQPGCPKASIVAFVQFDTSQTTCPPPTDCNALPPCVVGFVVTAGTVDGVYRQPCCTAIDDPDDDDDPEDDAIEDPLTPEDLIDPEGDSPLRVRRR